MSHSCVDFTRVPSGRFIVSGLIACLLLLTGTSSITNIAVAPVSANALDVSNIFVCCLFFAVVLCGAFAATAAIDPTLPCPRLVWYAVVFDITTVASSVSSSVTNVLYLSVVLMGSREFANT